jgi:hypothetical protein
VEVGAMPVRNNILEVELAGYNRNDLRIPTTKMPGRRVSPVRKLCLL